MIANVELFPGIDRVPAPRESCRRFCVLSQKVKRRLGQAGLEAFECITMSCASISHPLMNVILVRFYIGKPLVDFTMAIEGRAFLS
jgi:hypothetical protein